MLKHKLISLILFISFSYTLIAQTISGVVLDKNTKEPLIGATVIIKGTTIGIAADISGHFSFNTNRKNLDKESLLISFIGYKPKTIKINNKRHFKIELSENVNSLKEVVITSSYGTKKLKQEVVASITSIQSENLNIEQSAVSFDELLEGQAAGVLIESGAELGKPVNIHVRGQGSLTPLNSNNVGSSTQPIVIVDGVILAEEITLDGNNFFDGGESYYSENLLNPLAKIGIKDIETISVLKDAAAVSLYGADGANGVILITTKKGKKGPLKFNFSAQAGFSSAINNIKYMNGKQYQEIKNLFYKNSGQPENIKEWNGVNTNWHDLMNRTGIYQSYNFSMSGGSKLLEHRVSLGYRNMKESQIENNYSKYNATLSLRFAKNKFEASLKLRPSFTVKNTPNTLYSFPLPPTIAPKDSTDNYRHFNFYGNPLAVAHQNRGNVQTLSLLNSINASYHILENLTLSSLFGIDFSDKDQDTFRSGLNETGLDNNGNIGMRILRERNTRNWNWNAKLFYSKNFSNSHYLDALLGIETRANKVNFSYAKGKNFPSADKIYPIKEATDQDYENDKSGSSGRSFFSQLNYDFGKKYFALVNFRIDQSSAFGNDNNTSYNGGLGFSWTLSKEKIFKDIQWLDFLRLRASYGTSGNSRIGSYRALGLYVFKDTGSKGYNGGSYASPSTAPNPNLGWEKNYKFNVGVDFNLAFELSSSIEFFNDNIRDMIVSRDVISESGYTSAQINGANMYNRGIEISLKSPIVRKENFKWTAGLNFAKIKNKVTHLKGLGSNYSIAERARAQRIGYSTSIFWGYKYIGVDPATGKGLYKVQGNIVDANYLKKNFKDNSYWEPIGNSQPDFFGGFNSRFTIYKNFNLSMSFSYSYDADVKIQKDYLDKYTIISARNMTTNTYYDSWKKVGDLSYYPAVNKSNPLISNSSKYVFSISNIKFKSINLSYKVDNKSKKLPVDNIKVYANISNVYYWYFQQSKKGQNGIKELLRPYPEMRTISLGINVRF